FGNGDWIMNIALDPKESIETRKQALFWAGQSGGSTESFASLYDKMTDPAIKDQLIFVLSQSGRDVKALEKLMDIARTDKDKELRSKAIFWLGQSRDPRAVKFLEDLITKDNQKEATVIVSRGTFGVVVVALAAVPHLGAQSIADRVAAVKDGT